MEARQPLLEAPVIGIHILDMDGAFCAGADPFSAAEIDRQVRDAMGMGEGWISGVAVGDQQRLGSESRQQVLDQVGRPQGSSVLIHI